MQLKEFIKNALLDITSAIREASELTNKQFNFIEKTDARMIEFDVAVSVEESSGKSGGGGIKVMAMEAGGKISSEAKNSSVSRISFGIDIQEIK